MTSRLWALTLICTLGLAFPSPGEAAHSTCAGAQGEHPMFLLDCGLFLAADSNAGAMDTYSGTSCTGGDTSGRDVVWYADMAAGDSLEVFMMPADSLDAALYVVTDCADSEGTCVGGSDVGGPGVEEGVAFRALTSGRYFVIFDGNTTNGGVAGGVFNLWGNLLCSPVSTEPSTWGEVKGRYRAE